MGLEAPINPQKYQQACNFSLYKVLSHYEVHTNSEIMTILKKILILGFQIVSFLKLWSKIQTYNYKKGPFLKITL